MKSRMIFLAAISLALMAEAVEARVEFSGVVSLEMRPKNSIAGPRAYLSDIAKCSGQDDICRQMSGVDVGQNPLPGRSQYFNRAAVDPILEKEFPGVRFEWLGTEACRVESASVELPADDVKAQLQRLINDRARLWSHDGRVSVARLQASIGFGIRPTQTKIEFPDLDQLQLDNFEWVTRNLAGSRTIQVRFVSPRDPDDRTIVQAQLTLNVERRLPVLRSGVTAGDVVMAKNITDAWIPMRRGYQDFVTDRSALDGKRARQSIMPGEPVAARYLDQPIAVGRNQQVTMVVRKGDLEISSRATTVDQGAIGGTIEVINVATKKRMRARVIDDKTVEAVSF